MATDVIAGIGTLFKIATVASPTNYITVGRVISISGPQISSERIEITTLDSAGGYKEYIGGLKDGGEIQLEVYWKKSDAKQVILRNAVDDGTQLPFQITWPDSPATVCSGTIIVSSFGMNTAANEGVKATISCKLTGAPVWA